MLRRKTGGGLFLGVGCFAVLLYLAIIVGIVWTVIHFIVKFW